MGLVPATAIRIIVSGPHTYRRSKQWSKGRLEPHNYFMRPYDTYANHCNSIC